MRLVSAHKGTTQVNHDPSRLSYHERVVTGEMVLHMKDVFMSLAHGLELVKSVTVSVECT